MIDWLTSLFKILICWLLFGKFDFCDSPTAPAPSTRPSFSPSKIPTGQPSHGPSADPSAIPSNDPSENPSSRPSFLPSKIPTGQPSHGPSTDPSAIPSKDPSESPSKVPERAKKTCTEVRGGRGQRICGECIVSYNIATSNLCACRSSITSSGCSSATDNCFIRLQSTLITNGGACRNRRRRLDQDILGTIPKNEQMNLVGFVRVPKTGSTTLMQYLSQAKHFYNWEELYHASTVKSDVDDGPVSSSLRQAQQSSNYCIFGHVVMPNEKFGSEWNQLDSQPKYSMDMVKDGPVVVETKYFNNGCPHIPHGQMIQTWQKSVAEWTSLLASPRDFRTTSRMGLPKFELDTFTMVRDPFDRLVSYFYYLRGFVDTSKFLKHTVSDEQYEKVQANDLKGWMQLLYLQDGGCGLKMPNQYPYIHDDVNQAIAMVRNNDAGSPITVLVTECYEASLHLLAHNVHGLDPQAVQPFIESDDYRSNQNQKYDERPSQAELLELRNNHAEHWFADDFAFYHAAVDQFLVRLKSAKLPKKVLRTCKYWTDDNQSADTW